MTSPVREKLLSAEEYARTTDPPGTVTELVRGRIVTMPSPYTGHGDRAFHIGQLLARFVADHQLGRVTGEGGYRLTRDPDTVRGPDTAFLSASRIPVDGIPRDRYIEGAPDLAVEVLSPDDRLTKVMEKVADYLGAGAARVWIVDQDRKTVTVHRTGGFARTYGFGDTLTSDDAGFAVEGFELAVATVFE